MTVNSNKPVTGPHIADGVQTEWPFDWKVFDQAHVSIVVRSADGTTTDTYTENITVAPEYLRNDAGGYAKYPAVGAPIAAGNEVYVVRNVPFEQKRRIGNQGGFYPQTHEDAFDELAMQIQQINEIAGRSLVVEIGDAPPDVASIYEAEANALASAGAAATSASDAADALAAVPAAAAAGAASVVDPAIITIGDLAQSAEDDAEAAALSALAAFNYSQDANGKVPLGTIIYSAIPQVDNGYLLCDGAPVTALYPDLRAALIAAGSPFGTSGADPKLPDEVTVSRFRRAANGSIPLGTVQDDQIQSHDHYQQNVTSTAGGSSTAPSAQVNTGSGSVSNANSLRTTTTGPIGNFGSETRPKSIAYLPYIKAFGAITIEGMADLAELLNAIATEAEAILGTNNTKLMTPLRTRQAMKLRNGGSVNLSGTSIELTGIPADVQRVFLDLDLTISTGTGGFRLELGDASAFPSAGYSGVISVIGTSSVNSSASTTSLVQLNGSSGVNFIGLLILTRQSGDVWKISGSYQYIPAGSVLVNVKAAGLTGNLSRLRFSTGSAVTLGGNAKVWWEF